MISGLCEIRVCNGLKDLLAGQFALGDLEICMVAENDFHTTRMLFHPRNAADFGWVGGGAHGFVGLH